jgi:hypothetical protein
MGLDAIYGTATEEEKKMRVDLNSFSSRADTYCVTPCVVPELESNPKYRYDTNDLKAIELYWLELTEEGKNNYDWRLKKYKWIQEYYFKAFAYNNKPAETFLLDIIENFSYYQGGGEEEYYRLERILISVQISIKQKLLEEAKWELDPQFYEFTESELKILISLRRKYIDSL